MDSSVLKSSICVQVKLSGFHAWPDARAEVRFLNTPHRHLFTIKAIKRIDHSRQVEFFMFAREVEDAARACGTPTVYGVDFGSQSCETIAEKVLKAVGADRVEVYEDGENGSIVECVP